MTISTSRPRSVALLLGGLALAAGAAAQEPDYFWSGHTKGRLLVQAFPADSAFRQLADSPNADLEGDLRLNLEAGRGRWSFDAAYQFIAGFGDLVNPAGLVPGGFLPRLPNDDRRLFNLTATIDDEGKFVALHRLDRLSVGYTSEKAVVRFGRQALSWGNGLIFSPMDIVNPFDPAAVDTEFKVGDDMLYGQYLHDNGNDTQAAWVARRDPQSGDPASDQGTVAVKYHGIAGDAEYDLLLARNYGDTAIGLGGNRSIGGAVWRGDLVVTDAASGTKVQLVTNLGYSWVWAGKNVSGVLEYYFDEYGLEDGRYDAASLAQNPGLLQRLLRGQSFTLGQHYLAGGLTVELTPLWNLSPTVFANLEDSSALLQVVTRNNLDENMEFIAALNVPLGPAGSEYGGIALEVPRVYLSTDLSLFAQLAWYF